MLSVTQTVQRRIDGRMMNNELESSSKDALWFNQHLRGRTENNQQQVQNSRWPGQDPNQTSPNTSLHWYRYTNPFGNPTWEADSSTAGHEIPRCSYDPKFRYRVYKNPPLFPILPRCIQTITVHTFYSRQTLTINSPSDPATYWMEVNIHLHLAPRLRMGGTIFLSALHIFMARTGKTETFCHLYWDPRLNIHFFPSSFPISNFRVHSSSRFAPTIFLHTPQWNVNNIIPLINSYNVSIMDEHCRPFIHPSGSDLVKDKYRMYWICCQTGSTE